MRRTRWVAAPCAYEFVESALVDACGMQQSESRRTPPTRPPLFAGEPAAAEFIALTRPPNSFDRVSEGESATKARGARICVWGRLVRTGSSVRESNRVGSDFEPETRTIGILRGAKMSMIHNGVWGKTNTS
jgi:hypothetical protein